MNLHCNRLKNGAYQWKFSSGVQRYAKTAHASRGNVLRQWHNEYANMLSPLSSSEMLDMIRVLEGEVYVPPPAETQPRSLEPMATPTVEMVDSPLWRLPDIAQVDNFPSFAALQEAVIVSQKVLPKSLQHTLATTISWLLAAAEDSRVDPQLQSWSRKVVLLAPRLLWPAPPRENNPRGLSPNARPRLIKERLVLLHEGRWDELFELALETNTAEAVPSPPHNPGTITPQAAKALLRAARDGRIGPAWKQLWSHGLAAISEATAEAVQAKWAPAAAAPLPPTTPVPPVDIAEVVTSPKQWVRAVSHLKRGTAADAAGWTTEAFTALSASPTTNPHLRLLVKRQLLGSLPEDEMRCMSTIHILALRKDGRPGVENVRPISVPAIWRKLLSTMIVKHHETEVKTYLGSRQFGVGVSSGVSRFATQISQLAEASQTGVFIQTDISNAFGSIHRHSLQDALGLCSPSLAMCARSWLSRESTGYIQMPANKRRQVLSSRGLQQGDPLSALAFSVALEHAFRTLEASLREQGITFDENRLAFAYIDDAV
eukprot:3047605-Amphidinium_carterae.1